MSKDLTIDDAMSSTLQAVGSQDGDADSALSLSTVSVAVTSQSTSNTPLRVINSQGQRILGCYEGGQSNGNIQLFDAAGNKIVQLAAGTFESYINNGQNVGIGTSNPAAQLDVDGSFQASGQVKLTGVQPASEAPNSDTLETLLIDTSTWTLYYQ